jgi:3-hydroxyacyl-[acyl-carrier protein] dehydratase/trans-2-decenoyl-[acyl-carrier protein] isomerase
MNPSMDSSVNGPALPPGFHLRPAAPKAVRLPEAPFRPDAPAPRGGGQRQARFDREQLLACCSGELFGAGNAQLPAPPLLLLDRVVHVGAQGGEHGRGQIVGELDLSPDLWFFAAHFPGDPVMPGCLVLDALWQLLGFYMAWRGGQGQGRAVGAGEIRLTAPVTPEHRLLTYRVEIKRVISASAVLAVADGYAEADGVPVYAAKSLRVALIPRRLSAAPSALPPAPRIAAP